MIKRELSLFLIVGFLTVIIDFFAYQTLVWLMVVNISTAKSLGFITGTLFAYFANRSWTFGYKPLMSGSLLRFIGLYAATLMVNVYVNSGALNFFSEEAYAIQWSFLLATSISAALNFVGMKLFVFKSHITLGKI